MSMVEGETGTERAAETTLFPPRVGERLRAARVAARLDLNDVATRTRVPMRHLEAIERSDYSNLPSPTYAVGFVRSYARAVGADETAMAAAIRAELGRPTAGEVEALPYEPVDPARVPSRLLAWTAAAIGLVLLIGYLVWRSNVLGGDVPYSAEAEASAPVAKQSEGSSIRNSAAFSPSPSSTGQVVLTATAPVWLRIYDKANKKLLEKEMAVGDRFTVPPDADMPMVRTGRADAIRVTVDGREVAPLGPLEHTISGVGVSAAALAARPSGAVNPALNQDSGAAEKMGATPTRTPPHL